MMLKMMYKSVIVIQVKTHMTNCTITCDRTVVFSGYFGFLHQYNWPPQYNWNIVESGAKHHTPNNQLSVQKFS